MTIVYTSATTPATDQTFYFKLVHPQNGTPKTGLTITALNAVYIRDRSTVVSTALTALAAPDSAHTDNRAIEVHSTNSPGLYRVDFPDAAFATGVNRVIIGVIGAAIDPAYIEIELIAPVNEASVNVASISNNAITANSINNDAITAAKIATNAIDADALATDAVGEIADGVWDEALTGATHNIATSAGRRLRQLGDVVAGTVTDSSPSTTDFDTSLSGYADNFFNDQLILFTSGNLSGQVRVIQDFIDTNNNIIVDEPFTQAPANGDAFDILPYHDHPVSQIADFVLDEVVEGSYTLRQLIRLISSVLFAKVTGGGTTTITFRDVGDGKNRVTATVDSSGNRSAITLDGT